MKKWPKMAFLGEGGLMAVAGFLYMEPNKIYSKSLEPMLFWPRRRGPHFSCFFVFLHETVWYKRV